jgi:hypothetical protein
MTDVNDLYWLTTIAVQENANSKYMKGQFMNLEALFRRIDIKHNIQISPRVLSTSTTNVLARAYIF